MKEVLISIQPKWCELIANGQKTIEVRKTKPKLIPPFKCYIYETKGVYKSVISNIKTVGLGKVIGEFMCDRIDTIRKRGIDDNFDYCYLSLDKWGNDDIEPEITAVKNSCVLRDDLNDYGKNSRMLYGWHISDLVIYDKPKELSEFGSLRPPQSWVLCRGGERVIPFPNKKYSVIYADPPWSYKDKRCNGNAADHYPTMCIEDICSLPVQDLSADNCVLFLWATYPMLKEAVKVIEAWGFKYKSIGFQWVKQNRSGNGYFFGLGRWTRGNTEPCLIAVKGKPHRASNSVSQLIFAPLRAHSQKPDITRDKIKELMGEDHSYIELFARNKTPGWDVWGNEVD